MRITLITILKKTHVPRAGGAERIWDTVNAGTHDILIAASVCIFTDMSKGLFLQ